MQQMPATLMPVAPLAAGLLDERLLAARGDDHLREDRLVAVAEDVDLLLVDHAEIGPRADGLRAAEEQVLHVRGDHRSAPAVGEGGPHRALEERDRVRLDAVVRAGQQLHHLAVDAARRDAELRPALALPLGRAERRHQRPLLGAELRAHRTREVERDLAHGPPAVLDLPLRCERAQLLLAGERVAGREAGLCGVAQDRGHLAAVVAVARAARGHRAREVAGDDQVGVGAAGSDLWALAEGIDATRPHVADVAAQAQVAEAAERLHAFVAVPGRGDAEGARAREHLASRRVDASFALAHRLPSLALPIVAAMRAISRWKGRSFS